MQQRSQDQVTSTAPRNSISHQGTSRDSRGSHSAQAIQPSSAKEVKQNGLRLIVGLMSRATMRAASPIVTRGREGKIAFPACVLLRRPNAPGRSAKPGSSETRFELASPELACKPSTPADVIGRARPQAGDRRGRDKHRDRAMARTRASPAASASESVPPENPTTSCPRGRRPSRAATRSNRCSNPDRFDRARAMAELFLEMIWGCGADGWIRTTGQRLMSPLLCH